MLSYVLVAVDLAAAICVVAIVFEAVVVYVRSSDLLAYADLILDAG